MRIWPFRYAVKLFLLLLFNIVVFNILFNQGFPSYIAPLPVLLTINSPYTASVGVLDIIQVSLANRTLPLLAIASILILGALFGRLFCGWACPTGFIQELIADARDGGIHVSRTTHRFGVKIKYFILAITLLVSGTLALSLGSPVGYGYRDALGVFAQGPFLVVSPDGTIFGTLPALVQSLIGRHVKEFSALLGVKLLFLGVFSAGAYYIPWFFCRYLCPLGALMAVFSRFSLLGMKRSPTRCEKCPHCVRKCPMQVRILDHPWKKFNDPECTLCQVCVEACPHGALSLKFP